MGYFMIMTQSKMIPECNKKMKDERSVLLHVLYIQNKGDPRTTTANNDVARKKSRKWFVCTLLSFIL